MKLDRIRYSALCTLLAALVGCQTQLPPDVDDDGRMDDGPVAENISGKLGDPLPTATAEQLETFELGRQKALHRFDLADGLGPAFNVVSCVACHERPTTGGGAGLYRNFFIAGRKTTAGTFVLSPSAGVLAGGVIRALFYGTTNTARPPVAFDANVFGERNPIPMFGVGLLAELTDEEILKNADPDDLDSNGISGRPNFEKGVVGRFGRKSQTASIEGFIRGPLFNHMGITTPPLSDEQRAALPVDSTRRAEDSARIVQAAILDDENFDDDDVQDPEMSSQDLFELVSFSMLLAAPTLEEPSVQSNRGRLIFHAAGCSDCHTPRLESFRGPLPVYSDLLLHDMGEDLADGIVQGVASASEFRTQPLWGVSAVGPYLHDGRADTLFDAILAHGGEGQAARDYFDNLEQGSQEDVIEFLLSLGGRDQYSEGLIPPNTAVADVGEFGGPLRTLTTAEANQFMRGRAAFDRDHGHNVGVGGQSSTTDGAPRFNGDSCRACHTDPVVGGAGPRDVNVMRQCIIDAEGKFELPADVTNSVLHRHARVGSLPVEASPGVNLFEHRQTPHLFGLGLVDAISEETIEANADPDDANSDGISGRPNVLADGRIGRLGWKADVPSVAEFVRDGMGTEMGITVEPQDGLSFGMVTDNDGVPDPELTAAEAEDLTFFMSMLAPPPRKVITDADEMDQVMTGESLFKAIGCSKCHIPSLESSLGDVPLYSDLLLHEILPDNYSGIESADAHMREFRTAPLWGLRDTAPYFHTGEADTIEQAIMLHNGEATAVRTVYESLSADDKAAVLAFLNSL